MGASTLRHGPVAAERHLHPRRLETRGTGWGLRVVTALVLLFLYVPVAVVVLFSFNGSSALNFPLRGLSLQWYEEVLTNPVYTEALRASALVGVGSALCTALLGTLAALGLSAASPWLRPALALLFFAPIALPGLFVGLSLLVLFGEVGVKLSLWTAGAAHLVFTFPFYVLIARAALERLDPRLDELGADLGAGPIERFRRVTFPLVAPVLAAATVLAFALSFDEFIITFFVIGPENTVPLVVWSAMHRSIDPSINALATLLVLVTVVACAAVWTLATLRRQIALGRLR